MGRDGGSLLEHALAEHGLEHVAFFARVVGRLVVVEAMAKKHVLRRQGGRWNGERGRGGVGGAAADARARSAVGSEGPARAGES